MLKLVLFIALSTSLVLPAASEAQRPDHIALMGVNKSVYDGVAVTLRCNVADQTHCRTKVSVRLADSISVRLSPSSVIGMRRGTLLAERTLLVPVGGPHVVWLRAGDPLREQVLADSKIRVGVLARQGDRRITTLVRSRLDRIKIAVSSPPGRTAGGAPEDSVVAASQVSGGCGRVVSVKRLEQGASGVYVELATAPRSLPENTICTADIRIGCVRIALEAPLGERTVWQRAGGLWQAFPAPAAGVQGSCPMLAPGGTVIA